jgi:hypothetical protein
MTSIESSRNRGRTRIPNASRVARDLTMAMRIMNVETWPMTSTDAAVSRRVLIADDQPGRRRRTSPAAARCGSRNRRRLLGPGSARSTERERLRPAPHGSELRPRYDVGT